MDPPRDPLAGSEDLVEDDEGWFGDHGASMAQEPAREAGHTIDTHGTCVFAQTVT